MRFEELSVGQFFADSFGDISVKIETIDGEDILYNSVLLTGRAAGMPNYIFRNNERFTLIPVPTEWEASDEVRDGT